MRVSVVIPTYERAEATTVAVCSVLAQEMQPFEIIVVDDHSSVPFAFPAGLAAPVPIRVIRHDHNGGAAEARNTGVAAASGEWIAFLDSDDTWMPDKLARQIAFAGDRTSDALICYATGFERLDIVRDGRPEVLIPAEANSTGTFAAGCWFAPGSTAILHRKAFELVGGFDSSLRRLEDLDWFLRFGLAGGRLEVAPFVGSVINVAHRPDPKKVEQARSAMLTKWSRDAGHLLQAKARRRLAAYLNLECASANFYEENYWRAASFFVGSIARAPRLRVPIERWWQTGRN